jgi:2,4-dienoyl-CoA reductase-like NADH-dependent reductase (Old Yellow Enzyme family)
MTSPYPHLFSPLAIRNVTVKNRIVSTGHDTMLPTEGLPNDRLIAYHRARAKGGAGLIVVQVAAVHPTAFYTTHALDATDDRCIPGYRRLAQACHGHGCKVFAQLFHPGREVIDFVEGAATVAYAPSAVPSERFHVMPRVLSRSLIGEIVASYGDAAVRMQRAGVDGVEIVASHGYLPSQFLNPRLNRREDEYGGSPENRLRFLREVIADVRAKVGDFAIGMRISGDEKDPDGLHDQEAFAACEALDADGKLDYFNVIAGSSASLGGAIHIVPPMAIDTAPSRRGSRSR